MWQLAAESLERFPEVVITAINDDGYPVSIRQRSPRYDAETGQMPVVIPASVSLMPAPANVLAHHHDENLSELQITQIKGRLEKHYDKWVFVSTTFRPPPRGRLKSRWQMAKTMRRTSRRYLSTRRLPRPKVNWAAIKCLQRQAQLDRRQTV
jgi:hypothetical protein